MSEAAAQVHKPLAGQREPGLAGRIMANRRVQAGGGFLFVLVLASALTLPWTLDDASRMYFDHQDPGRSRAAPAASLEMAFGADPLGRSVLARCLLGGAMSLGIGISAALISVVLGVSVGLVSGYCGGWIDAALMRFVDILYGLPYILLVILIQVAFDAQRPWNVVVLVGAIGLVSWLTMARVVRGQVLSLRAQPFIEAARAAGLPALRIFRRHLLPNLVGPVIVYATLLVPQAILQESFLSFLGVGIQRPIPTWGAMAAEGIPEALNQVYSRWWLLVFPCTLLGLTLLCLNFLGDGLRDVLDPRSSTRI